jgi:hypothetical protein
VIDREPFIRPSSMAAIEECPGRPLMEARICALVPALRDLVSEPARQGTLGHSALAGVLGDAFAGDWSRAQEVIAGIEGRMAGMAYWTKDATRAALAYGLGAIQRMANSYRSIRILVEHRLAGACIEVPSGGSADLIILCYHAHSIARAVVIDWKLGWCSQGEAGDHLQLGCYAAMTWNVYTPPEGVEVHLAMGRRREFSAAMYDRQAIDGIRSRIKACVRAARAEAPTLRPSIHACRYCRALVLCRAAREEKIMTSIEQFALFGAEPSERIALQEAVAMAKRFAAEGDALMKLWRAQEAEAHQSTHAVSTT